MGCSSHKDAKTPQSLPQSRISSAVEIRCKICYSNYDQGTYQPMVIPCGHSLCKNCLVSMPKSECPYDRVKFDKSKCQKNYEILEILVGQGLEQKKNSVPFTEIILCNKKHKTQWSGVEELCSVCQQSGPGFKCSKCSYNRCIRCFERKPTRMCYNGHKTKWSGDKARCVKCRKSSSGWQCLECVYCYCHQCSKTEIQKGYCPNGHGTIWNPSISCKENCAKCGKLQYGFVCEPCKFVVCKKCSKYQFGNTKCPNSHLTVWANNPFGKLGALKCQNCDSQSHGYACDVCMFLICTYCCKWNFCYDHQGITFCPNKHQTEWRSAIEKCIKCQDQNVDGFVCPVQNCKFCLCRDCSKLQPVTRTCFNKHSTVWKKQKSVCLCCNKLSSGWDCQKCISFFCSSCTSTSLNGIFCPNFHKKTWVGTQKQCELCRRLNHGWQCSKCEVFTCSTCQKTDLTKDCPNKHPSQISKDDIECLVCLKTKPGWICRECKYNSCFDCLKGKINAVSCPYYHLLHNIPHEGQMKCQRCKESHQEYRTCQNRCLVLCQQCTLKK